MCQTASDIFQRIFGKVLWKCHPGEDYDPRIDDGACRLREASEGVIGEARDIASQLLIAKKALKQSDDLFNLFLKNTPADIAMFDTNLRHIAVSRRYCESVCLPADDLIDKKTLLDLFPVHPDYWVDAIKDVLTKGTPANSEGNECAILWNGRTKWCNWQVFPWAKLDDSIGGMILLSEDVTEEMSLRAELLNKNIRIVPKGNFPELTNSDVRMYSRM